MKLSVVSSLAFASLLTAAGCGNGKSNPVSDYSDISQKSVPLSQTEKTRSQGLLTSDDLYVIESESNHDYLVFREGQTNTYKFKVRVFLPGVNYALNSADLPKGAILTQNSAAPDEWNLSWPVPGGYLAHNETQRSIDFHIDFKVLDKSDPNSMQTLSQVNNTKTYSLLVFQNDTEPTITLVQGLETPLNAGERRSFTVQVLDPSSSESTPPALIWSTGVLDGQRHDVDASPFVHLDEAHAKPKSKGDGLWLFHFVMEVNDKTVIQNTCGKDDSLQTAFQVVYSRSGKQSAEKLTRLHTVCPAAAAQSAGKGN